MSYLKTAKIHVAAVFTLQNTQFVRLMYVNYTDNYNARQSLQTSKNCWSVSAKLKFIVSFFY